MSATATLNANEATPAAPVTPAAVATPVAAATPPSPATPSPAPVAATPAAPATPATPAAVVDGAPAAITLQAPEGVEIADADLSALTAFATENKLSQAQADKMLAREIAGRTAATEATKAQAESLGQQWMDEAKAHPEIGGEKLTAALANAQRALSVYATAEERAAIAASPFANNPMFIAIMSRAAKGLAEDGVPLGSSPAATKVGPQVLYPMYYKA